MPRILAALLVAVTVCHLAVAAERAPLWKVPETPAPLAPARIDAGAVLRVSLREATRSPAVAIRSVDAPESLGVTARHEGLDLVLRGGMAGGDPGLVTVRVATRNGEEVVSLPVLFSDRPVVRFKYKPKARSNPSRVSVAGSFNGWNRDAHPMEAGADGVFRTEIALSPGSHTYKLVVDGEWITDPANPLQERGGYGNSLVNVEPARPADFRFAQLAAGMPGAGRQGGAVALIGEGARLDPASVQVLLDNRALPREAWTLREDGRTLAFDIPDALWMPDSFVGILGRTTTGGAGATVLPVHREGGPRSPRDEVIYFAMTDRFHDGDPELNQPVKDPRVHPLANYHGGDFAGIRAKIEEGYFRKLGVTTLWISPVNENIQEVKQESVPPFGHYTSYHGYWPISSDTTNRQFGSMDELRALISTAHRNGIAVLLDFVANHVYETHPLLNGRPQWVVPRETPDGRPNLRLYDEFPLTTWFDSFIPTLDYDNQPELVETMTGNAVWWLRQTGADGFRHDAVKHIPNVFWRSLTARLREEFHLKEGRLVYQLGETISNHETVNAFLGPDMLSGQFDFPIYFAIEGAIARSQAPMSDVAGAALRSQETYPPSAIMSPLIGNHDVIRFLGWADGDIPVGVPEKEIGFTRPPKVDHPESYAKLKLAFATLAALPGPPTLYYGDEIGMTGAHDPDNRRPMPWNWDENQKRIFEATAALNHARLASHALRRGHLEVIHADAETLILARITPTEVVLATLVRRPAAARQTITLPAHWGQPRVEPVAASPGITLEAKEGTLNLQAAPHGYALHRVIW